jgi:6-phosphogluconolactonase
MKDRKKILIFNDINEIISYIVDAWKDISEKAIRESGKFTVALSGGSTPIPLYQSLADHKDDLPWNETHIFQVDERFVPKNHSDSNQKMIRESLIEKSSLLEKNFHPVPVLETCEKSARKYSENIKEFFSTDENQFPEFNLVLLGIGDDGHTASLFPNDDSLKDDRNISIPILNPAIKHKRITLTFPVINNAENIIFIVTGENKSLVIKDILDNDESTLPASLVNPIHGKLIFLMDYTAASGMLNTIDSFSEYF